MAKKPLDFGIIFVRFAPSKNPFYISFLNSAIKLIFPYPSLGQDLEEYLPVAPAPALAAGSRGVLVKISGARDIQSRAAQATLTARLSLSRKMSELVSAGHGDEIKLSLLSSGPTWWVSSSASSLGTNLMSSIRAHQNGECTLDGSRKHDIKPF